MENHHHLGRQADIVLIEHLKNESQLLVLGLLLETDLSAETNEEADLREGASDSTLLLDASQLPLFLDKILMQLTVSPQLGLIHHQWPNGIICQEGK